MSTVAAPDPARDYENAAQRAEPNPNLLTFWDSQTGNHLDVNASQLSHRAPLRIRIAHGDRPATHQFINEHRQFVARWRGTTYRITRLYASRGYLDMECSPTIARPRAPLASIADLYARIEHLHDAVGTTDDEEP